MAVNTHEPFGGFHIFCAGDERESSFVAPVSEMSVDEFVAKANCVVKDEWGMEEEYHEVGYPFTAANIGRVSVVFDPNLEYEDQKGLYTLSKKRNVQGAIECFYIDIDLG